VHPDKVTSFNDKLTTKIATMLQRYIKDLFDKETISPPNTESPENNEATRNPSAHSTSGGGASADAKRHPCEEKLKHVQQTIEEKCKEFDAVGYKHTIQDLEGLEALIKELLDLDRELFWAQNPGKAYRIMSPHTKSVYEMASKKKEDISKVSGINPAIFERLNEVRSLFSQAATIFNGSSEFEQLLKEIKLFNVGESSIQAQAEVASSLLFNMLSKLDEKILLFKTAFTPTNPIEATTLLRILDLRKIFVKTREIMRSLYSCNGIHTTEAEHLFNKTRSYYESFKQDQELDAIRRGTCNTILSTSNGAQERQTASGGASALVSANVPQATNSDGVRERLVDYQLKPAQSPQGVDEGNKSLEETILKIIKQIYRTKQKRFSSLFGKASSQIDAINDLRELLQELERRAETRENSASRKTLDDLRKITQTGLLNGKKAPPKLLKHLKDVFTKPDVRNDSFIPR
jgi:hypothetical protein